MQSEKRAEQELRTERAHYMCPNMHFGILARVRAPYDTDRLRTTVAALQQAHPFLRSLIAEEPESGRLFYRAQEALDIPILEKAEVRTWQADYDALAARGWNVQRESMLRLLVYPEAEGFSLLMMAQHLLCDGRGLMQLMNEFAAHYVRGEAPGCVEERLIASLDDLPPKSALPFVSRAVVDDANRRWDREDRRVPYADYLAFERQFIKENPVRRELRTLGGAELARLQSECRQHGVSVNDRLIAELMRETGAAKVVMAADIRDRVRCYRPGALGNYSTAFSVAVKRGGDEPFALEKQVAARVAAIRKQPQKEMLVLACYLRMRPALLDAAAISALGGFESASAAFVGGRMFGYAARSGHCVTNLGRMENELLARSLFIPPASPANQTTWGVLTLNGEMNICAVTPAEK